MFVKRVFLLIVTLEAVNYLEELSGRRRERGPLKNSIKRRKSPNEKKRKGLKRTMPVITEETSEQITYMRQFDALIFSNIKSSTFKIQKNN